MSFATFFEKIAGKQKAREQARIADYRSLVIAIVAGKEPTPEQVDLVLRESAKTLDDLRADVELRHQRVEYRQQFDRLPELYKQQENLKREFDKVNDALAKAEKAHEDAINPLQFEWDKIKEAIKAGEAAGRNVATSCTDADLRRRSTETIYKMSALNSEATELREAIRSLRGYAEADRDRAKNCTDDLANDLRAKAKDREARANALEKELIAKEKSLAALQKEEAAVESQILEP